MTDAKRNAALKSKNPKRWSYCVGERGQNRVRAFEHAETGRLFLEFYEPTHLSGRPRVKRVALGHRDRGLAKAAAEKLACDLRQATPPGPAQITLGTLIDNYLDEVTRDKGSSSQQHDRRAAELFLRAFGRDREARSLNRRDLDSFVRARRSGQLRPPAAKKIQPVANRTIEENVRWLLAVFNWGTRAGDTRGHLLLERNPWKGLDVPKEESPHRPKLSSEEYQSLLEVAPQLGPQFTLALVLAHETGHRVNAIRLLRWSDVDLSKKRLRWRAESDKVGFEHVTPITEVAMSALARARANSLAIGDAWLFPAAVQTTEPTSRYTFLDWWRKAEQLARIPRVKRRGWHSLRRMFANDLRHVPLRDLAALGGWKEPTTVLKVYQSADEATMRAALDSRPIREVAASQ